MEEGSSKKMYGRTVMYTLEDDTIVQLKITGSSSITRVAPNLGKLEYDLRWKPEVINSPKKNGPPGKDSYTVAELKAHSGKRLTIMNVEEEWSAVYDVNPLVAVMSQVAVVGVWETDLFYKSGRPVYRIEELNTTTIRNLRKKK